MVISYPKSFRDELEGQVVGTGYDSLVKQFISPIDNWRHLQTPPAQKRLSESHTPDNAKKACKLHMAALTLTQSFLLVKQKISKSKNKKS